MTTEVPAYIGSDLRLTLDKTTLVLDDGTQSFLNVGTCTYEIKTLAGYLVTDGMISAAGSLTYVTSSDGKYLVVIDKTISALLKRSQRYDLFVYFGQDGNEATFALRIYGAYQ